MLDRSTTPARRAFLSFDPSRISLPVIDLDRSQWMHLDPATMAAIQTGRIPTSNPGGASHA